MMEKGCSGTSKDCLPLPWLFDSNREESVSPEDEPPFIHQLLRASPPQKKRRPAEEVRPGLYLRLPESSTEVRSLSSAGVNSPGEAPSICLLN